jgi:hypothetical protein
MCIGHLLDCVLTTATELPSGAGWILDVGIVSYGIFSISERTVVPFPS